MKVREYSLSDRLVRNRYGRELLRIELNDKTLFDVSDGEPEDATLARDFNDCYGVIFLMQEAHKAGLKGEAFDFKRIEIDSEDDL